MHCNACRHENPEGARFCNSCGGALAPRCPACTSDNPPGSRFCNSCGEKLTATPAPPERDPREYTPKHLADKILTSRAALGGARKQITVLGSGSLTLPLPW